MSESCKLYHVATAELVSPEPITATTLTFQPISGKTKIDRDLSRAWHRLSVSPRLAKVPEFVINHMLLP